MDTTKEKRYEDLVNAVEGGQLSMVKFLWNLVSEIDELVQKTPQGIVEKRAREVDALLKELKSKWPKDGKTPTPEELLKLIKPLIPKPIKGEDGKTPSEAQLLDLIERVMPDPIPGPPGFGLRGPKGEDGFVPAHRWNGTFIQFQNPDGSWGTPVNLQGPVTESVPSPWGGGVMPHVIVRTANGQRFEGVHEIVFADNLTVTKTINGVSVSGENGGSGGSGGIDFETPTGTVDDSNLDFTVSNTPLYIVVNGAQMFEGAGYSYLAGVISLDNPIGTGGFIRSAFGTGISIETPTGAVDDSNVTFTVTNEPKYIVVNGAQYFAGAGYSYVAVTLTLDNPVGTGGFIRSIY